MTFRWMLGLAPVMVAAAVGCGNSPGVDASTPVDAATSPDVATTPDVANSPDVATMPDVASSPDATAVPVINGCTEAMYTDMSAGTSNDRMIMPTRAGGLDMPCMTIATGQGVMFMWNFVSMPVAPGVAPSRASDPPGTAPNPIQMHATGGVYTVTFRAPGFYPYYVPSHETMMLGTIQVR